MFVLLRDYQQAAHDAVVRHLRRSLQPVVIDAATGSGKSYIIAALAETMHSISGGKGILCLAPSRELVLQNHEKYLMTGTTASIFSASAGEKCLARPVVFGTPLTVKGAIDRFTGRISTVVLDEAHGITPTIRCIVDQLRDGNEHLRVVGLTATPYRLGEGYIYRQEPDGKTHDETSAKDPFFARCIYRVAAGDLIDRGFLAKPALGAVGDSYDTSGLELNRMRRFDAQTVDRAFLGHGRLTSTIVGEIVRKAELRRGVMVFASTVAHAQEVLASLPPELSAMVTGKTKTRERAELLRRFKARELKYLVNVSVLTTGFDAAHVDLIAVLRATESAGLLQQIIGRGLRACEGKTDCLILDYAENIERHCPDGDIFSPEIKAAPESKGEHVDVTCPACGTVNEFALAQAGREHTMDDHGYCIDLRGKRILSDYGPMPGHHGRRCQYRDHRDQQCAYRWTSKPCPSCGHENDIAARRCGDCKTELVDPNKKLRQLARMAIGDPKAKLTEPVLGMSKHAYTAKSGAHCIVATFTTPTRQVQVYLQPASSNPWVRGKYQQWRDACMRGTPAQITYRKQKSGYFDVLKYS